MAGFTGFEEVKQELKQSFRESLVNLAVVPLSVRSMGSHDYLTGRDMATGHIVRAVLADRRGPANRPDLWKRLDEAGEDGVLVLVDCWRNRNGTYEAYNAIPFPAGNPVLVDGVARVSAPFMRDDGSWRQSIQHLRTGRASACASYADVVDAVLAALSEGGPGRAGAVVRGWHAARDGAMGFEVGLLFDPEAREYLPADPSFDAFLASPDVFVAGLGVSSTGEQCMGIVSRLIDEHPGEIVWEVIPKRTYSLSGYVAESAGHGTGPDASGPYRMDRSVPDARQTGCLPSVVAFIERGGILWPRLAVPSKGGTAVPELRVTTASVSPRPLPGPAPQKREPLGAGGRNVRRDGEPSSSELLRRVASAGPGTADLGARTATEDVAAACQPFADEAETCPSRNPEPGIRI